MPKITKVWAREILDSRGDPTVEVAVQTDTGVVSVASSPAGTTEGKFESLDLRDNDPKKYRGRGVVKAVQNINTIISSAISGQDPINQFEIDLKIKNLDNTPNKKTLGTNATTAVSMAVAKAAAGTYNLPLYTWISKLAQAYQIPTSGEPRIPTPIFNLITGGIEGAGNLDFQEFQVIPATSKPYHFALQGAVEIYHTLRQELVKRGAVHSISDHGGYAPNLFTNADALEINLQAIKDSGYEVGQDFFLGLDATAARFYRNGKYSIKDRANSMDRGTLIEFYESFNKDYRLTLLEDPLFRDDWEGWVALTAKDGGKMLIVGDDLLATNLERVKEAVSKKACNGMIIKPNQAGTITETLEVIKTARGAGWKIVVAGRAGDTNEYFLADFAVGVGADMVKFGAPARGERVAKYNRLSAIHAELSSIKIK